MTTDRIELVIGGILSLCSIVSAILRAIAARTPNGTGLDVALRSAITAIPDAWGAISGAMKGHGTDAPLVQTKLPQNIEADAERMYELYCLGAGGKSTTGTNLPAWQDLPAKARDNWRVVAVAS